MAFRTNKMPVLQEKSASGAVATFNTALAMPLKSCTSLISGYQEGSGTPSPDNVRPITGLSSVNVFVSGVNLWDEQWEKGNYLSDGTKGTATNCIRSKTKINIKPNTSYYMTIGLYNAWVCYYDNNGSFLSGATKINNGKFTTPNNAYYMAFSMWASYGSVYNNDISINYPSSDTQYHAYNGTTVTINLGGTYYGGEYDARTGVFTVINFGFVGDVNLIVSKVSVSDNLSTYLIRTSTNNFPNAVNNTCISSHFSRDISSGNGRMAQATNDIYLVIDNTLLSEDTPTGFVNWLTTNSVTFVYEIATPQTIQLPPCPIDTLLGVNNIWSDTGDVDLTYKDLDIAKRGNFREVFKLPS